METHKAFKEIEVRMGARFQARIYHWCVKTALRNGMNNHSQRGRRMWRIKKRGNRKKKEEKEKDIKDTTFLFIFLWRVAQGRLGHSWLWSGLTPGSMLEGHTYSVLRTLCSEDWSKSSACTKSALIPVLHPIHFRLKHSPFKIDEYECIFLVTVSGLQATNASFYLKFLQSIPNIIPVLIHMTLVQLSVTVVTPQSLPGCCS